MNLNLKTINNKLTNKKKIFITVDGITCSGKTIFSKILKKNIKNSLLISKDIFLLARNKRIRITKSLKKNIYNQNLVHYDTSKINSLISFLLNGNKKKKLVLKKLYNRKKGINNMTKTFYYRKNQRIIYEGIYVNDDIVKKIKPSIKILLTEKIYTSLFRKIERIRDKKISIQNLATEFTRIHLKSFLKYLEKNCFDVIYTNLQNNFAISKNGKAKQINDIKKFFQKHLH